MRLEVGITISEGTLKAWDIANALLPYAERYLDSWPHKATLEALRSVVDAGEVDIADDDDWEDIYEAMDSLQEFCPPYAYIGSHPGDGALIGVWSDMDAIETAVSEGDLQKVADLSEIDSAVNGELIAIVNDHGNLTLARVKIEAHEVWAIV